MRGFSLRITLITLLSSTAGCERIASEVDGTKASHAAVRSEVDRAGTERLIREKTNAFRRRHDRAAVTSNDVLKKTARDFAEFMARTDKYGHEADGRKSAERATAHGYDYCLILENIAWQYDSSGYQTETLAAKFVTGWENSEGHRKNMLDADVVETGVGIAHSKSTGRYYAVQLFGRPKSQAIQFTLKNEGASAVSYRLGEKRFLIEPRYRRQHTICRPEAVEILAGTGPGKSRRGPRFRPTNGARYVLKSQPDGEVQVSGPSPPESGP